jgi:hypothetical protein
MNVFKKAAVLFVVAGFSAAIAPAADPALLNLLMPETKLVVGINIEQAKNTPFGQSVLARLLKEDAGFARFVNGTGFDPRRDLREVVIASTGNRPEGGLVVARGFFNSARLAEFAKLEGATVTDFQGVHIISGPKSHRKGAFAFLDSTTAVGGDIDTVKAAISRRDAPGGLSPVLQTKIGDLSANDVWFASTLSGADLASRVPDSRAEGIAQGDILQAIEQSSAGVKFGTMVEIKGEALMRSDKDATALADVARFLGSMVQLNRDKPGAGTVATLLEKMDIRTEANIVKFSLAVPQDQLEKLMAPRVRRAAALR